MMIEVGELESPVGHMTVAVHRGRVCAVGFTDRWARKLARLEKRFGRVEHRAAKDPADVVSRLHDYFAGKLDALARIDVDPGGTPFQRRVWTALRTVPPGQTVSYGALARSIGAPGAVRAVGAANGANPVAIVIPCHRVIGADGRLAGYAAGTDRKRWLLAHEGVARGL